MNWWIVNSIVDWSSWKLGWLAQRTCCPLNISSVFRFVFGFLAKKNPCVQLCNPVWENKPTKYFGIQLSHHESTVSISYKRLHVSFVMYPNPYYDVRRHVFNFLSRLWNYNFFPRSSGDSFFFFFDALKFLLNNIEFNILDKIQ